MATKQIPRSFWNGCSEREVLFGVHHELDRPILVIRGYGNLLLNAQLSENEKRKAVQQIVDYIEFLQSLTDSLGEYLQESHSSM
jgi:nitrogen-specific signal transduction histidine kinase